MAIARRMGSFVTYDKLTGSPISFGASSTNVTADARSFFAQVLVAPKPSNNGIIGVPAGMRPPPPSAPAPGPSGPADTGGGYASGGGVGYTLPQAEADESKKQMLMIAAGGVLLAVAAVAIVASKKKKRR